MPKIYCPRGRLKKEGKWASHISQREKYETFERERKL
jgi:hypothetical protein